jgi:hypothetical protein
LNIARFVTTLSLIAESWMAVFAVRFVVLRDRGEG